MDEIKNYKEQLKYLEKILPKFEKKIDSLIYAFKIFNDTAEDLKQDILLKAIEKIDTFQARSKLESWIYRIAINHCISFKKKKKEHVTDCIDSFVDNFNSINSNPEKKYLSKEKTKIIHNIVFMLPKKLKEVVLLYNFDNLSQKQIAVRLGIPLGTVWSRMNKAKYLIRKGINNII